MVGQWRETYSEHSGPDRLGDCEKKECRNWIEIMSQTIEEQHWPGQFLSSQLVGEEDATITQVGKPYFFSCLPHLDEKMQYAIHDAIYSKFAAHVFGLSDDTICNFEKKKKGQRQRNVNKEGISLKVFLLILIIDFLISHVFCSVILFISFQ